MKRRGEEEGRDVEIDLRGKGGDMSGERMG
jgi:hypothetical protein